MIRILVDADVVIDVLLDRQPHADAASVVWSAVERDQVDGVLAAHTLAAIDAQIAKSANAARASEMFAALLTVFGVAGIDEVVVRAALAQGARALDDALILAVAQRAKCSAIVTRHPRRFHKPPVRVLTPEEASAWLATSPP